MDCIGKYTSNETRLMTILAKNGGPVDSKRIVTLHYNRRRQPRYAQKSVVSVLNALSRKVVKNRERFRIKKTVRCGPMPISYWIERS